MEHAEFLSTYSHNHIGTCRKMISLRPVGQLIDPLKASSELPAVQSRRIRLIARTVSLPAWKLRNAMESSAAVWRMLDIGLTLAAIR